MMDYALWVGRELLPQVKKFKYLRVFFMSQGKTDHEINRQTGAVAAVMQPLHQIIEMKREPSPKAKLSIHQSIYIPTLIYGHKLWVVSKK